MNLKTSYLGLELHSPLMPGASPLADNLDMVRRLEDAGAAAIVMRSLFEEQLTAAQDNQHALFAQAEPSAEAASYFPKPDECALGPDDYLEQLRRIKAAVRVPVIASLNGITPAGWLLQAQLIEKAGADALELNVYYLATDPEESGLLVEERTLEILRLVKKAVSIPVAMKLSPFFSSLPHFARQLTAAGADALILFNRFYQPDIDIETLEAAPSLHLSDQSELLLRLRWLALLYGNVTAPLVVTGGVHDGFDAIKAVMAGATAVQLVSALIARGPAHLTKVQQQMERWMEEHEYESIEQMRGSMSLQRCPDPTAFSRANYMRMLQGWRKRRAG